mgnify:CR=1 FL=1
MPSPTKRYAVYAFPSLYGTPWYAGNRSVALAKAVARLLVSFALGSCEEIRVVDTKDDNHLWVI